MFRPYYDPSEDASISYRSLLHEWQSTKERWNDDMSAYFETHFWNSLEQESRDYVSAVTELMETIVAAGEVIISLRNL